MPRTTAAKNRVVMPKKPIEPMEMEITSPETVELPSTGSLPGRDSVIERQTDGIHFNAKAEALAFNEEKVTIMIHDTSDPNAEKRVFLGVNGRGMWLERGIPYIITRKFVEVLARAKPEGVQTISARDHEGMHTTHIRKSRALQYPFSVIEDSNPRGAAWLREIMAQP